MPAEREGGGGRLNRVFEMAGIPYRPRPEPGTKAHVEALKKRKVDANSKVAGKRGKGSSKEKS
jgi:hypothetical protein